MAPKDNFDDLVRIEAIDHQGRGIAHQNEKTIFIENALLGEKVSFRIFKKSKKVFFAKSENILEASPQRSQPICTYYGICGGCSMQHYDYGAQVAYKQKAFEETLWHVAKVKPDTIFSPIFGPQKQYRHKARLRTKFVDKKNKVLVGFNEKLSHFLTDMTSCEVLPKKISNLLGPLQKSLSRLSIKDAVPQIEYASNQDRHILVLRILKPLSTNDTDELMRFQTEYQVEVWTQTKGHDTVKPLLETTDHLIEFKNDEYNLSYQFNPTGFTQINPFINQVMIRRSMYYLDPKKDELIFDFFCGLGNFTLPIATFQSKVVGFEGDRFLVDAANKNAQKNKLDHLVSFMQLDLFKHSNDVLTPLGQADKWLIDPPRDGAQNLIQQINQTNRPKRIVYVSCNPASLARDAGILVHEKNYTFKGAGILNMFPHTSHVESISVFESNED